MIENLKSENSFLKEQLKSRENYFLEEIKFLRGHLSTVMTPVMRDGVISLSCTEQINLHTKTTNQSSIPTKLLKEHQDICKTYLFEAMNKCIRESTFPNDLKLAHITPVYKKDDTTCKKNYRPVSVLPTVSKILFERLLQEQIVGHVNRYLSPFLCAYRTGFSSQDAIIGMIEKWKSALDKQAYAGAIFMDLSKAFDTLNHELPLPKLYAYGFDKKSLSLMQNI